MRNYSANLYRKFKTRAINTLNGDDFYEYFMKVVESGARFYGQKNLALVKTIDERWVAAIKECLIPLENIIKRPRKFIERQENIVPIELARKVGSDAVKHLASHTHFISRMNQQGEVVPNKILNVYNDDSYHIYENRFVFTLLGRINQFIDRRYDALFGTAGDEFESVLKVDSEFNDNDEKVEYNLILKVHQGQNYLDNSSNDPQIYNDIEHIRLMLAGFSRSEFYQNMIGCTPVRSPISRTNLIMKQPDFRKCYELWQFLDKYNEVGYMIERREYASVFDENYLDELNTLVLFNYLVLKNNLESEHNKPIDVHNFKKKRTLKPKFISKILEEFVFDYDIPEAEMQQVFFDEISKAYSKKIENEDEIREALERALGKEQAKKEKGRREEDIRAALEYALGIETRKWEKLRREDEIKEALSYALGVAIEKHEIEKREEEKAARKLEQFQRRTVSSLEQLLEEAAAKRSTSKKQKQAPLKVQGYIETASTDDDFGEEYDNFLLQKELELETLDPEDMDGENFLPPSIAKARLQEDFLASNSEHEASETFTEDVDLEEMRRNVGRASLTQMDEEVAAAQGGADLDEEILIADLDYEDDEDEESVEDEDYEDE